MMQPRSHVGSATDHRGCGLRQVDVAIASGESLDECCLAELNIEYTSHGGADSGAAIANVAWDKPET